jgi:hypothetical protein
VSWACGCHVCRGDLARIAELADRLRDLAAERDGSDAHQAAHVQAHARIIAMQLAAICRYGHAGEAMSVTRAP